MPFGSVKMATLGILTGLSGGYWSSVYEGITAAGAAGGLVSCFVCALTRPARKSARMTGGFFIAFLPTALRRRAALHSRRAETQTPGCGYWLRNICERRAVHPRRSLCRYHRST